MRHPAAVSTVSLAGMQRTCIAVKVGVRAVTGIVVGAPGGIKVGTSTVLGSFHRLCPGVTLVRSQCLCAGLFAAVVAPFVAGEVGPVAAGAGGRSEALQGSSFEAVGKLRVSLRCDWIQNH